MLGSSDVITPEVPIGAEGVESQELRRPGPMGDKAVASVPSAKLIALTKIGLPRAGRCGSSFPGDGSAFEEFCQVKYFLSRSWQLTFESDFAEFARDFSIRIAAGWPSALLSFVHICTASAT